MIYHNTPEDMARALVTYIPCDKAVQREVASTFISAPPLSTIKQLRISAEYQSGMAKAWRDQRPMPGLVDKDQRYEAKMAAASFQFAQRLVSQGWHA